MKIAFHGAARNVTGSKHLITLNNGTQILLDCGMFQGMGQETDELNDSFGFDASKVDILVLSHAHIDHSGLIPRLIAQGFKGVIFGTQATKELSKILLLDSAKIQAGDLKYTNKKRQQRGQPLEKALYEEDDVLQAMEYFVAVDYHNPTRLTDDVTLEFIDAGHIIGSASVHLTINEDGKKTQLSFSGDVGQYGDLLLRSPQEFPQADYILLESTYGDKLHKDAQPTEEAFLKVILDTCVQKKGKVIIPAFSVGRTQELLYILNNLELEGKLPDVSKNLNPQVIISKYLADRLHLKVGNKFNTYFMKADNNQLPNLRVFEITGIYNSGFQEFDATYIIGDIRHIQQHSRR
ncbi:MAG: MBL fold metallo-hydrolase [Pedobacter sp.]|nr:MAG: MBL fold metallo-hydrolase [Pedobacter sp.]